MKLVVAEKPSVAMSLSKVIGATKRQDGYLEGNGYLVSWCVGHLVELSAPERYDERFAKWRLEDLPILPERFLYEVSAGTRKQYQLLKGLMERSDVESLVCATDAGREGELIFRLVYKGFFETILVGGKMRVVIESFENWYAHQAKYHKVTGEPPGELLKQESYSAKDIAGILGVSESYVYEIMKAAGVKPVMVDFRQRFRREDFERWYSSQTRFRNDEDRHRDEEMEESSMSMPDMARLLDVSRSVVYGILQSDLGKEMLEVITIAGRKRITRESFDRWYASQTRYLKPEDQPEGVPRRHKSYADTLVKKKVKADSGSREVRYSSNPDYLTIDEAAYMAKVSMDRIYRWIQSGKVPALKIAKRVTRIPRRDFEMFLEEYMKQDKE